MKETSAGAIIYRINEASRNPKYLLLHYGGGHWDFVKGHVESNETEEQTMLREAREESGLTDLRIIPGFREKISYFFKRDGKTVAKDVVFLLAETKAAEKSIKLSYEHSEYEWLEIDEASKKVTYDSSRQVLKKADKFLAESAKQERLNVS